MFSHCSGYSVYGYHVGGKSKYIGYWHKPYFQCGVVAAFAMAILISLSLRSLRRRSYEVSRQTWKCMQHTKHS